MRDAMRVGQRWQAASDDDWRTIVQFNVAPLEGTHIVSASVLVTVSHSADCTKSPLDLYRTNWVDGSKAVTWDNTVNKWWKQLREVKASANKDSCPKADDQVEFGDPAKGPYNVRGAFQDAADKKYSTITFAFRAPDESDEYQWKKLKPDSTYLDVVYDRSPGKPAGMTVAPCDHSPCTNPAKTSTNRPRLTAAAADVDGDKLRYEYEVYDNAKSVLKAKSTTDVTGVKQGTPAGWTVVSTNAAQPGLPDGTYQWHVKACDSYVCGPESDWFAFTVDTTNPSAPAVTSDVYKPADSTQPDAVPGGYGGPGVTGQFTFAPGQTSDGVAYYLWTLTGDPVTHRQDPNQPDGSAKGVPITPTREGPNTLTVEAVDAAGNRTALDTVYPFKVLPAGGQWVWNFDEPTGTAAGSLPVNNRPATPAGSGVTRVQHNGGRALELSGAGEMVTGQPVLDTSAPSGFTVAAWVYLPGPDPTTGDPGSAPSTGGSDDPDAPTDDSGMGDGDTTTLTVPAATPATNMTVVSQDGVHTSMFRLEYRTDVDVTGDQQPDNAWCFSVATQDQVGAPETRACSGQYVAVNTWTHLVGVVDNTNGKVRLYVNGGPLAQNTNDPSLVGAVAEVDGKAAWAATGNFVIGRGQADGPVQRWIGDLDDVRAVPRVWSDLEIQNAASTGGQG